MEWKRYHLHSSKLACIIQMLILQSAGQFKRPYRHKFQWPLLMTSRAAKNSPVNL
ncbi:hypothetical protein HanIR_Chr16g0839551 [Helianthus annuus]|nr:hypothetical protein HanIR_Chr16g0839551 [Helianthus annuus]